ncbi:MAG: FlgD immunoglobulin-like domain containing protein [Candidatus Stygibacter australis]|nr:FlgD immunoglobulin-like domain containing protein [Candidatus Stygibacter australis]
MIGKCKIIKIEGAFDGDHFEFSNCNFTNLKSFSICSLDSIEVNFANCSFEDNYRSLYITYRKEINGAVVETSNNVNATITECTFYDNYNGILIESGSGPENLNYLQVNSSDFGKLDGQTASGGNSIGIMAIGEESETTVKGCNFYDNDYGIFANKTLCQVGDDHDGNNFQYNEKPLYMSTMDDTVSIITYNTISNNETNGIYCYLGDFGINNNTISVNEGHGVVAISSVIRRYNFNDNDINNNGSIEIYASAENMRQLENGGNIIEDDSYVIPPSVIPLSIWKYYSDFDRYILAAEYADSLMNVFGNTIPDSTDSLRFYPSDTLYVFTESRNSSYNAGIAAYNNGEYNTAVAELSEYISENPYINRSHSALPYLYFAERRTSGNMAGYRQFSDTSLPYTTADTLMYWQMKLLYADSYLADHDYSEAIESYQEILENEPSYDDSLQAAIMQGYAYLKFTQEGERNSNIECLIQTSTLEDYCDYLLHCTDEETGNEEVIPVISRVFNYPNPFNPDTKICFQLREPSERVTVTVYNIKGQKVWEYTEYDLERGKQEVVWTGVNRSGRQVASGVYLYRIKADGCKRASKMLLLK